MNTFIYDSFLNHKKYDRLLARLETRITDLGLNGKICRLSFMRNIHDTVTNELRRGAKTFIAVGNNKTVNQIINSLAGSSAAFGIIPIGEENNDLAKALGIGSVEAACDVLSARLLARLDLGLANNTYFLGNAAIENHNTVVDMNKSYTIEAKNNGLIYVFNLPKTSVRLPSKIKLRPDDGVLELVISGQSRGFLKHQADNSVFKIKKVTVSNPKTQLILDGSVAINTPAEITVTSKCLNVIVGKERNF